MNTKHEFALYNTDLNKILSSTKIGGSFLMQDSALITRIVSVLRLQPEESFIFFDAKIHATCTLEVIGKKSITCTLVAQQQNVPLAPAIHFVLPVLKRDDLETALYSLVELGANSIQLVITEKIQRAWASDKEFERAQRIMIAAAEQSKNFALPELREPVSLNTYFTKIPLGATKIFFDVDGEHALSVLNKIKTEGPRELFLIVGPEADLTSQEKELLKKHNFIFCQLTPTILRAAQAVALGLGMFRSTLR